jgi:hypothetical protein
MVQKIFELNLPISDLFQKPFFKFAVFVSVHYRTVLKNEHTFSIPMMWFIFNRQRKNRSNIHAPILQGHLIFSFCHITDQWSYLSYWPCCLC